MTGRRKQRRIVGIEGKRFALSGGTVIDAEAIDIYRISDEVIANESLEILDRYAEMLVEPGHKARIMSRADRLRKRIAHR